MVLGTCSKNSSSTQLCYDAQTPSLLSLPMANTEVYGRPTIFAKLNLLTLLGTIANFDTCTHAFVVSLELSWYKLLQVSISVGALTRTLYDSSLDLVGVTPLEICCQVSSSLRKLLNTEGVARVGRTGLGWRFFHHYY